LTYYTQKVFNFLFFPKYRACFLSRRKAWLLHEPTTMLHNLRSLYDSCICVEGLRITTKASENRASGLKFETGTSQIADPGGRVV